MTAPWDHHDLLVMYKWKYTTKHTMAPLISHKQGKKLQPFKLCGVMSCIIVIKPSMYILFHCFPYCHLSSANQQCAVHTDMDGLSMPVHTSWSCFTWLKITSIKTIALRWPLIAFTTSANWIAWIFLDPPV
jgi:hypothetical protein